MAADPLRKLPEPSSWSDDPFRYGTRWKRVRLPNGEVIDQPIPLTPDDLLDPQPGDETPQSDPQTQIVTTLFGLLTRYFAEDPNVVVFYDMKIVWGIPGLPSPSPNITVLQGLPKKKGREIYRVAEEGVIPCLIIEAVSFPDAAMYQNEHEKKREIYQTAGVAEYLIVDPPFPPENQLVLTGYRLSPDGRYERISPDARGHLYSETTDLFFAPFEDEGTIRVGGAATVEWLLTPSEESEARKAAEERAHSAEAENARLRAEIERLKKAAE